MSTALRERLEALGDAFWLRPAILVLLGLILGEGAVWTEQWDWTRSLLPAGWLYAGGEAGARALLGAIATSTIGVAGTTFSITVAALSLASGQMGPRLLRNFVRDAGNQVALGVFLGTFVYALVVLRTVRSVEEGAFVPHLGVTGALVLALLCVGTLTWFVHHIASGINVETVIGTVHAELRDAVARLTLDQPDPGPIGPAPEGRAITAKEGGYLRALDEEGLAGWAAEHNATLNLLVRPGDYVFTGVAVATVSPPALAKEAVGRVREAMSLGDRRAAAQDLEFAVRQLAEVAVRALSPGINDPFTAMAVLDRFGDVLCGMTDRHLPGAAVLRDGRAVLFRRAVDYDGLLDAMFHMIRQNGAGSAAVLLRLMEVLGAVLAVEQALERGAALRRHADLVFAAGRQNLGEQAAVEDLEARFAALPRSS
ncbi:MAG: DUF2254 domain-containing protein [Azospirillum brasilense]|uniref:DUF2254 domain-containing protein n=1 Tax=Roseomonas TaxID=125216 RepID=UPI000482AAB4|nr:MULTISPECIES: DUF2254 domain-containing protein [Roseomonas]PZP40913.1 MAG: DUF2254 domain-containing protein [Azospirillum brasilense]QET91562.1 DUF2254 domain-containing protein [Roseomonas mucosa]GAV32525.1 hypothetical protein ROTAS13_00159 [Roseomonas sp. TAS13]